MKIAIVCWQAEMEKYMKTIIFIERTNEWLFLSYTISENMLHFYHQVSDIDVLHVRGSLHSSLISEQYITNQCLDN